MLSCIREGRSYLSSVLQIAQSFEQVCASLALGIMQQQSKYSAHCLPVSVESTTTKLQTTKDTYIQKEHRLTSESPRQCGEIISSLTSKRYFITTPKESQKKIGKTSVLTFWQKYTHKMRRVVFLERDVQDGVCEAGLSGEHARHLAIWGCRGSNLLGRGILSLKILFLLQGYAP